MNIFRVRTIGGLDGAHGDHVVDGECWKPTNWSDWPLVVNSQNQGNVDLTLPQGVAHRFEPREKIMLQTHYVNATTQKTYGVGKVLVNFDRLAKSDVVAELGTAFATNQNLRVCPGQSGITFETTCRFAREEPVTIFGVNGHFHSRGRRFTMSVFNPVRRRRRAVLREHQLGRAALRARTSGLAVPPRGGISLHLRVFSGPQRLRRPQRQLLLHLRRQSRIPRALQRLHLLLPAPPRHRRQLFLTAPP